MLVQVGWWILFLGALPLVKTLVSLSQASELSLHSALLGLRLRYTPRGMTGVAQDDVPWPQNDAEVPRMMSGSAPDGGTSLG